MGFVFMSKYDWVDAPPEVNFIATDKDGWKSYFENEPRIERYCWVDFLSWMGCHSIFDSSDFKGDWRESLEKRP